MVSQKPCLLWPGYRNKDGYGVLPDHKLVHRAVWAQLHGPIPKGIEILHQCDNPPCFEPEHLFEGTQADNNKDAASKSRSSGQKKTHCKQGHELTLNRWKRPQRYCVVCRRERDRLSVRNKQSRISSNRNDGFEIEVESTKLSAAEGSVLR